MNLISLCTLISCIIGVSFGSILIIQILKSSHTKTSSFKLTHLVNDGLIAFNSRITSSIFQVLVYTTLVLLLFTQIYEKSFSWIQISAFFIGGISLLLTAIMTTIVLPKLIPKIISQSTSYLNKVLSIHFKAVSGLGILSISFILLTFILTYHFLTIETTIGFGLGIALAAFFLRIGSGLFKTSSDISADTISKLNKNIPILATNNPGTYLDITGDYIGKMVGFFSDIMSSFMITLISCLIFAKTLEDSNYISSETASKLSQIPLFIIIVSITACIIAYFLSQIRIKVNYSNNMLLEGLYSAILCCGIAMFFFINYLNLSITELPFLKTSFSPFIAYIIGLIGAVLIGFTSEYLTSNKFSPTQKLASEAEFGPSISLFNALSIGYKSNGLYLIYLVLIIVPSFYFAGILGLSLAALGMLSVTITIIIITSFSSLAEIVLKLNKLTEKKDISLQNSHKINQIGLTTQALGNGFASGAANLSTLSLFFALILLSKNTMSFLNIMNINSIIGLIIGTLLPYTFIGFLVRQNTKLIIKTLKEIQRQFREIPYLKEGKAKPDIKKAVDQNMCFCMDSLIIPGIIMALPPIAIGYIFNTHILISMVFGTLITGITQSFYWANFGDSTNNAKHYIEIGHYGGPDTPTHNNISIGDNYGDLHKDILSPSLNIYIKSVTIIAGLVILLINL